MAPDPSERALQSNRKECHEARDVYFQCTTSNNGQENKCQSELAAFKEKCPKSWVDHFVRKHKFEQFKKVKVDLMS
jgi:cytochrome c oxidase assembly factor 6